MVTRRMQPLTVDGRTLHQIGIPFHWGFAGETVGGDRQRPDARSSPTRTSACTRRRRSAATSAPAACRRHPSPPQPTSVATRPTREPVARHAGIRSARRTVPLMTSLVEAGGCDLATPTQPMDSVRRAIDAVTNVWQVPDPPAAQEDMGFFTDTTLCIGCKACEVACKQWNQLPSRRLQLDRQQLRQHRALSAHDLAARRVRRADASRTGRRAAALADDERRLQALRGGALPAGLPDRGAHLQRVRQRLRPARHLQRLRLLRRRLPVRRDRTAIAAATATPTSARSATTGRRTG